MKCENCGREKFSQLFIYCEDGGKYYKCERCGFVTSDRLEKPKKDHWFNEVTAGALGIMFGCGGGCFIYAALAMAGIGAGIWCCKMGVAVPLLCVELLKGVKMKTCIECKHYQLPDFCKKKNSDIHNVFCICKDWKHWTAEKKDKNNGKEKVHVHDQ